jgi:hypothetical protein
LNHPASIVAPRDRGTVSLVALCFAAVLGISLASYITISSRAMQFSNRSFQAGVSKQLAEVGIEEALRAFSKNDWNGWSSSGITVTWDTATHASNKRATATMSFPTGKFGQGTTATVKIRVDNYDAAHLGASWSSGKNYRINDRVGYNGIWYRCLSAHTSSTSNRPPNLAFWAEAPIPWAWCPNRSYTSNYDIVNHDHDGDGVGTWWRCKNTHTSGSTFDAGKWNSIPYPRLTFTNPTYYGEDTFLFHLNTWYRSKSDQWEWFGFNSSDWDAVSGASTNMPTLSWAYRNAQTYAFNDVVYYNVTWYRCISTSSTGNIPTNTTHWENALSGSMHGWNTSLNYNLGDVVYHSGTSAWYRCIRAHSGQTPSGSSVYWANTPLFSTEWDAGRQYSQNDTVRHNGVWYLSLQNSNAGQNPATATSYWMGANTTNTSYTWSSATSYSVGAYRCYGGVWYRCLSATTANANHTPNNTTYWTSAWSNSWGITTGAPVVYAEATVNIPNNPAQKTQLRALLAPAPLFPNAAGATSDLTITTGTGTVDSYDSKLGAYNQTTSPFTPSAPNVSDSAVLAAAGALAVNGTTHVKGYLAAPSLPANISTSTTVKGSSSPVSPKPRPRPPEPQPLRAAVRPPACAIRLQTSESNDMAIKHHLHWHSGSHHSEHLLLRLGSGRE